MYFADIIGQMPAKRELIRTFKAGIVPHARLFVGEDGGGGLGLAYAYARYINCLNPSDEDACGYCRSCLRFNQYASQDLHFLFPIVNVGSRNLCEDELPRWREFLARGPYTRYSEWADMLGGEAKRPMIFVREGEVLTERLSYHISEARYRILLIWLPERMHEGLGNKLLKLVEEPPKGTVILMVTQSEGEVLGTLRSRMQTLHLRPLSEQELISALEARPTERPGTDPLYSAHMAGGNYRRALDSYLGQEPKGEDMTTLLGRILRATVNARPIEIRSLADELARLSREELIQLFAYIGRMLREIYIIPYGLNQINYLTDAERKIAQYLSGCLTSGNVPALLEELDLATRHIAQNVNSRMVLFDLILRFTSTLAPAYRAHGIR